MKKALISLAVVVALLLSAGLGIYFNRAKIALMLMPKDEPTVIEEIAAKAETKIDVDYISEKIEKISSLQTAKITYGCMVDYSSGWGLLTGKSFSMFYEATAYAGIDVKEITVKEANGKFIIQLPAAKIIDRPIIDPSSFVFYDKENGLLNHLNPEDTGTALEYAQKDVYYQSTTDQLLELADSNAVSVIKNLLLCFIEENQFEIIPGQKAAVSKSKPPIASDDIAKKYDGRKLTNNDLKKSFEDAGFTNIKMYPIKDVTLLGLVIREGMVDSVTIDGKKSFKKSSSFNSDAEVVIKYHARKK